MRGVDLMSLPLDRALNVAYAWIMPADPQERFKVETQLLKPLPQQARAVDPEDDFWSTAREDGAAFMAAMANQTKLFGGK
jgi:hypothetical protein